MHRGTVVLGKGQSAVGAFKLEVWATMAWTLDPQPKRDALVSKANAFGAKFLGRVLLAVQSPQMPRYF